MGVLPLVYTLMNDSSTQTTMSDKFWLSVGGLGVLGTIAAKSNGLEFGSSSFLGIVVCVASILAACFELILVKKLANGMKMSPADTVVNMALPAAAILLIPAFAWKLPNWPSRADETNVAVFQEACKLNQWALPLIILSGVFATLYNQFLYKLVQQFSPEHTAFASNANKLATIALSILLGFETCPSG